MTRVNITRQAQHRFEAAKTELGWESHDNANDRLMLLELCVAVEESHSMVRHQLDILQRDMDRLSGGWRHLGLNTLGELQQRPAAVEAAIGAASMAERLLEKFMALHRPNPDEGKLGCAQCGEPKDKHFGIHVGTTGHRFVSPGPASAPPCASAASPRPRTTRAVPSARTTT